MKLNRTRNSYLRKERVTKFQMHGKNVKKNWAKYKSKPDRNQNYEKVT